MTVVGTSGSTGEARSFLVRERDRLVAEGSATPDEIAAAILDDALPKQLYPPMPVVLVKAAAQDKAEARDVYACPVYKTQQRGPTFVFTAGRRTKAGPAKWVLAGVALILDVVEA